MKLKTNIDDWYFSIFAVALNKVTISSHEQIQHYIYCKQNFNALKK